MIERITSLMKNLRQKMAGSDGNQSGETTLAERGDADRISQAKETPTIKRPNAAAAARMSGIRTMFVNVIHPEERNLKNYLDINFWFGKRRQYIEMREKERQDLNVYDVLSQGAYPTIEYYVLTILSCIIATAGLLQGATATIIGAMIVAPLMTPILAFSLGIIWGDSFLISTSLKSLLKGILLAIGISAAIAFLVPTGNYSPEILSRTNPTIFDIIVALVSGVVGAYGYANKNISATLVGIAIAVALMPPLCTVGIGLGTMNLRIAGGAFVLFAINLVSISLSGAVIFWMMKIHPLQAGESNVRKRAILQIVVSVIILTGIAVPIAYYMREGYLKNQAEKSAYELIQKEMPNARIIQHQYIGIGAHSSLVMIISVSEHPDMETINRIKRIIRSKNDWIKELDFRLLYSDKPNE